MAEGDKSVSFRMDSVGWKRYETAAKELGTDVETVLNYALEVGITTIASVFYMKRRLEEERKDG